MNRSDGLLSRNRRMSESIGFDYKNPFATLLTSLRLHYNYTWRNMLYEVTYKDVLSNSVGIDNTVTHVVDLGSVSPNPFNQPFFILLNLALGASTDRTLGGKLDPDCLPVEFPVDYVIIYQTE